MTPKEAKVLYAHSTVRRFFLGGTSDSLEVGLGGLLGRVMRFVMAVRVPSTSDTREAGERVRPEGGPMIKGRSWDDGDTTSKEKVISRYPY